jgi:hypothetical protein|tara:strand:+ start:2477 stop:3625 length:1149 start_codon:yes stop_codon:yes gene_type:complete
MEAIWPGSGSAVSGNTPFALYDNDTTFQSDSPKFANWCAKRLGYPIMAIELQDSQFYACFEEAITEYSSQVNQFNIRENLLSLRGHSTGSNVTHKRVTSNFAESIRMSEQYGTEAGVGGTIDYKSGSISVNSGSQVYDLNTLFADVSESGKAIEVRRVYYEASPAVQRYFDPYAGTGAGSYNMLDGFGWGNMTPAVQFMMMPIYADMLRMQAIEFNDQVRKSTHTFELRNNKIRIFPNPTSTYNLWFEYILKEDRDNPLQTAHGETSNVVSDYSNVPYDNMEYKFINDVGLQWIRKYGLALSKELLGMIRSKYGSIPVPNAETTLDGDTLRNEAATEKELLVTQLRENLEASSRKMMLEADSEESTRLQEKLNKVPLPIYIG